MPSSPSRRARLISFVLSLAVLLAATWHPHPAHASTITVNSLADSGSGSLRQAIANNASYTPPADATTVSFTVERVTPGQPTTIPLTVVDECGSWPSFVGGGGNAGF
jgi:hypothetical protein